METEEYGQEGSLIFSFTTINPISTQGVILIQWPTTIEMFENTTCNVTTNKLITS